MDPDSCGVIWMFAPIGPWAQSEYSSLLSLLNHIAVAVVYEPWRQCTE